MLPYKLKIPGYLLVLSGILLSVLYFAYNFRFELPVLAVVSSYAETRFFAVFKTNFADETIMLLVLAGLGLVSFTKEKKEVPELSEIRIKALTRTALAEFFFLLFSILFIYGGGFMAIVVMNLFLPFVIYIIIFNILKADLSKKAKKGVAE